MNRVHQPRTLVVLGPNAGMGTAAGADELAEIPTDAERPPGLGSFRSFRFSMLPTWPNDTPFRRKGPRFCLSKIFDV